MSNTNKNERKKIAKVISSIIVPLVIGIATVLISIVQLQIANKQRTQDLQIAAEQREHDLRIADNTQKDLIVATYIEHMSELMLSPNFTLHDPIVAPICRAKTLLAIRQLDSKRKTHLIKFLYEANMIRHDQAHIHLADVELDNIDLSATDNRIEGTYRCELVELSLEKTSLNNASFAHQMIIDSTFEEASLIGANFTGCRFSSTNFVGAILRYANFSNATSKEYLNLKSADLFGSSISDELLLNAISIEDAILPNGTRGIQPNLLIDGDAEFLNCQTNTSIPSSWSIKQIFGNVSLSVLDYTIYTNSIYRSNGTLASGQCFYAARGQEGKIMMRQEILHSSMTHMPIVYGNVVCLLRLFCAPIGILNQAQSFAEIHLEQFDRYGMSLHNYTKSIYTQGSYKRFVHCHKQLYRLVFTLSFIRLSNSSNSSYTDNDVFFYCDNIYLTTVLASKDKQINSYV